MLRKSLILKKKIKELELRKNMKFIKKTTTIRTNENTVKASFAVSSLIVILGKPPTIVENQILFVIKAKKQINIIKI